MNNISSLEGSVKLSLFCIFLLCSIAVRAEESTPGKPKQTPTESSPQIWLTSGFLSHHFKRDAGYNEQNTGLGFEYRFDDSNAIVGGIYRNSVRERSHYLEYAWTPIGIGPVRIGAAAGGVDGYPQLRNGKLAFAFMPIATVDFKLFNHDAGLNFVYIPTVAPRVDGALAMQLKIRLH
jgi:hypothetical protein